MLLLPALLTGCLSLGPASHADVLPTEEQIRINLPLEAATAKADEAPAYAEFYSLTRTVTEDVNGMIGWVLGTVGYVVTLPPTWKDAEQRTALWGPWSDSGLDPVEVGLWVTREEDDSWTWAIFYLPQGGDIETDTIPVVAGVVDAGATRDDATGRFLVDFTTAGEWEPSVHLTGGFGVEYDYDPDGVAAVAFFEDYGWEGGGTLDAAYAYAEDYAGSGDMDLAWLADLAPGANLEVVTLRSRWTADGPGRGDARVVGGDLGATEVTASECWGSAFTRTYWTDSHGLQPGEGEEGDCAFTPAEYATEASFALSD